MEKLRNRESVPYFKSNKHLIRIMKLTFIALFICITGLFATEGSSQTTRVNISMHNVNTGDIIEEIEKQTDYLFLYASEEINLNQKASINAKNQTVAEVLNTILQNTDIVYAVEGTSILLMKKENPHNTSSMQQDNRITGTITDEREDPIIGANIVQKGTTNGVVTDIDGNFSITAPANATLQISYIGYITQEVLVGNRNTLHIQLKENSQALEEVVVIGYGSQRKSDMTGGISSISSEKIDKIPAVNLSQRLQGQVAGLNITSSNNEPGREATFRIRGEKSLSGSNDPLIVLDGIPFNGDMGEIDQNSVESISVLKDASSATIYGSRAANGVILITTKKGKIGQPMIRYNGYIGIQQAEWLPEIMNGPENIQVLRDYRKATGDPAWDTPEVWLHTDLIDNYKNGRETDWYKEVYRTALQQEHQISMSGATNETNYYVSLSFTDQQGIVKYTGYEKFAITSQLTQRLGNWLTVGMNLQLSERDRGGQVPNYGYAAQMSPYGNVYNEDGTYKRYPMFPETMFYSPFANQDAIYDDKTRSAYTSAFAEIKLPLKGLTYRTNFGYSYRHQETGKYYGSTTMTGEPLSGKAEVKDYSFGDWTWENILRYDNDFGKHHIDLTALYSAQKTYATEHFSTGENFLTDNNSYHNIDMAQGVKTTETDKKETALLSWMARANYAYDRRYLLTLTGRRDGFSAFGEGNNKWAFFPAAAAAWVISEEEFFEGIKDKIDFFKLRVSYGLNGNQAVTAYQTKTKLVQKDYIYGNEAQFGGGLVANFTMGNPNLKWETSKQLNIGLDYNLLSNRVSGSLEFYQINTDDLLMNRTVPVMNGYMTMMDNVGSTRNRGFELSLNTENIVRKDFQWTSMFVLSGNWSKIVSLREDGLDDIANKWFIGQPVRVHYDYKVTGIWQEDETSEMANTTYWNKTPVAGDAKIDDKNGDGKIDADDRQVIGSRIPVWTAGLTNTFTYKNLSLSVFLNGVFDVTRDNSAVMKTSTFAHEKNQNYFKSFEYWTPENKSNTHTRIDYKIQDHGFYKDASYLRIQDVNLSYRFPKEIINKIGLQGLTTYVNGRNLFTFSGYKKYSTNLEESISSDRNKGYSPQRVFIFGVNVTF